MTDQERAPAGLVHVYCGDGKGKTTAGVGLCIRAAGYGYRVLICQFMKDDSSSERRILEKTGGITLLPVPDRELFSFQMDRQQKEDRKRTFADRLEQAFRIAGEEHYRMLFLDEVLYAVRASLIDEDQLVRLLRDRPEDLEVILTGRDPGERILELADYVSRIEKVRHPFDRGIQARCGIER